MIVLLVELDPVNTTQMLRYNCQKTHDPIERYDKVLELLSAAISSIRRPSATR